MAFPGGGQIIKAAFAENHDAVCCSSICILRRTGEPAVGSPESFAAKRPVHSRSSDRWLQTIAPSFHFGKMLAIDYVTISGNCDKDVANRRQPRKSHDSKSIHHRSTALIGIDFGDDYIRAHGRGHASTRPCRTSHNHHHQVASQLTEYSSRE